MIYVLKVAAIIWLFASGYSIAEGSLINDKVTQSNINSTICVANWTSTVRPPSSYTNKVKRKLIPEGHSISEYELDHLVPLSSGGHPTSVDNLWLQPWVGNDNARQKDTVELYIHKAICNRTVTLEQGRDVFRNRQWTTIYDKLQKK